MPSLDVLIKYLRSVCGPFELWILACRVLVFVKPELTLDDLRVLSVGEVGRLRAWRMGIGTGDMVGVVCVI